jgi:tetratricopeptide (TPR) repeat protein
MRETVRKSTRRTSCATKLQILSHVPDSMPIRIAMRANESSRLVLLAVPVVAILTGGIAHAEDATKGMISEAVVLNNQAVAMMAEGRYPQAEQLYQAALHVKSAGDLTRAKIAYNLASLYKRQDRYLEAERILHNALEWRQKNLPAASVEVAYSLNNLAEIYRVEGRDWEARNLLETAARTLQQSHPDAPGLPIVLGNLAVVRCRFGDFAAAEELLRKALLTVEKRYGSASIESGVTLNNLAQVVECKGDFDSASQLYSQAIVIFEGLGPVARVDLATALANSAEMYQRLDRIEEARRADERALELLQPQGDAVLRSSILRNFGNILAKSGNPADSLPYFEQSLHLQEKTLGTEYPATAGLLLDYASATRRSGNKSLSRKLRKRAAGLLARMNMQIPNQLTVSVQSLRETR